MRTTWKDLRQDLFGPLLFYGSTAAVLLSIWLLARSAGTTPGIRHLLMFAGVVILWGGWLLGMLAWNSFRPKPIAIPGFGTLEYQQIYWSGSFNAKGVVWVTVFAGKLGPTRHQRQIVAEVRPRFDELLRIAEGPLFSELQRSNPAFSVLQNASDVWIIGGLPDSIQIQVPADDECDLEIIYHTDADPDRPRRVRIEDWKIVDVSIDELDLEEPPQPVIPFILCPYCSKPLRTVKAMQCFACGMDWHDPDNVVGRA